MNLLSSNDISNFSNSRLSIGKKIYKSITSKSPQYSDVINLDKSNLLSNFGDQFSPESSNVLDLKREKKNKKNQFKNNLRNRNTVGNGANFQTKINQMRKEDIYRFKRKTTFNEQRKEEIDLKNQIRNFKNKKNNTIDLKTKIVDLEIQRKKLIDKLKFCHLHHNQNNENIFLNENIKIKEQNFLLKRENKCLKEELKDMDLLLNGDTKSIILSNKFDQLNSKINTHKNKNNFLLKKNIDLLDKLKKSRNLYFDTIEKINKTKIKEKQYIINLKQDLENQKQKNQKLEIKLLSNFSGEEKLKLKKKIKKLENKNSDLNNLVDDLKNSLSNLEKNNLQSSVVSEKMKFLEKDFNLMQETFKKNIKGKNKLIKSLKIENTKLSKKLSHLQEYNKNNILEEKLKDLDNLTFDEKINNFSKMGFSGKTETNYTERINSIHNISSNLQSLQSISKIEEKNSFQNLGKTRFTTPSSLTLDKDFNTTRNSQKINLFNKKNGFFKSEMPAPLKTEKKNKIIKMGSYGSLNKNLKGNNYITNDTNIHVHRISVNSGKNNFKVNQKNKKNSLYQFRDRNNNRVITNKYKKPNEIYMKEVVYFNNDGNGQNYFKRN